MGDDPQRYARVHELFGEAEDLRGAELDAYLAEQCEDDPALRREVEAMLAAALGSGEEDPFSEASLARARQGLEKVVDDAVDSWLPDRIGDYDIVRQIGQGGMGIVYEAVQQSPRRSVAIKLMHPTHATTDRMRRFRREAELLGRLQHANIAQIYEASTYDVGRGPQPYFAMELVDGVDILTHCSQKGLGLQARIELLEQIADAVQYAHDRGVIHRDLKPDNVLIDAAGRPRILDFGVARTTDDSAVLSTLLTQEGQLVGTLAYMAPEQLSEPGEALTTQVDVYGLGVLAFELLTNQLPRNVEDVPVSVAMHRIMTTDVVAAGMLDPRLAGEIESILGKALEAEPGRRYATAADLAADLRRYLDGEPVHARPPSRIYLARKFARRHRSFVVGAVATLVVAVAGAVVALGYAAEASRRADELELLLYRSSIGAAGTELDSRDLIAAETHLDAVPAKHRGWEYDYLRARLVQHVAEWQTPAPIVSEPVFSEDGQSMFAMMVDGHIGTWDVRAGRLIKRTPIGVHREQVATVQLHGPSRRFAARSPSGELLLGHIGTGEARVVPLRDVHGVAWSHDGEQLLILAEKVYILRDGTTRLFADKHVPYGAWSPASDRIVFAKLGRVALHDAASAEELASVQVEDTVQGVAFAPDGETLAVAGYYRHVFLFDGHDLSSATSLAGHRDVVWQVAWTAGGTLLSTANDDTVRVWDSQPSTGALVYRAGVQDDDWDVVTQAPVPSGRAKLAVLPGDAGIVVAGDRIRILSLEDPTVLTGHDSYVYRVAFSADGSMLASSAFRQSEIRVWDVHQGKLIRKLASAGAVPSTADAPLACFTADGRRLVTLVGNDATAWDVDSGAKSSTTANAANPHEAFYKELAERRVDLSYPAGWAVTRDASRGARVATGGSVVDVFDRRAALAGSGAKATDSDPFAGQPSFQLVGHTGWVYAVAFSPDGKRIATGGNDATVAIWDAATGERLLVLRGHTQYVMGVAWSPDGSVLASASGDKTIRLWDSLSLPERRAQGGVSGK